MKLPICAFVALFSLVLRFEARGVVPGTFQQVNCDGGGWFSGIVAHPGGRLYGRTDVGGLYRSDNRGDAWTFLSGDFTTTGSTFVQGVATPPGNADVVYQCTGTSYDTTAGRGIWKSTDAGATWTKVLAGVNFSGNDDPRFGGECIVIQPGNDAEVWAGTRGDGLRRSIDAGANWTNVAPATFDTPNVIVCGVTMHPAFPDQIWVAAEGGVWVSVDHGVAWTKVLTMTRAYRVVRKADGTTFVAGTNSGNVLSRITATDWNNPATYTSTNIYANYLAGLPYSPGGDFATISVLANGDLIGADLFNFTRKSTNNGATWTTLPLTLTGPLPAWDYPGHPTVLGGRNNFLQDPTLASRWFLGGGFGPFRSDDGGATWRYIVGGVGNPHGIGETVAWRVNFHPTDPQRVWLPLADLGCATVADAGASGSTSGYIYPHFIYPDDNIMFSHRLLISAGQVIAPGGEQGSNGARIYKTTNHGATWTKLAAAGLPTAANRAIIDAVASSDNANDFLVFVGGVLGAGTGGIYRTTDGGASFAQAAGLPAGFDSGDKFYWHPSLDRDATNAAVRYLFLRNRGFYKSTDRGATWTKPAAQPRNTYAHLHVDAVSGRLWVGTEFSTGFDYSDNAGLTWIASGAFTSVTEFDVHGGRLAAIGQRTGDAFNKIYVSPDNGVNWEEITRPGFRFGNAQAVAVDPWRAGTVWISTNGRSISRFTPWTAREVWRNSYFGSPANTGNAADLADPDLDGYRNAVEYALGLNPTLANAGAVVVDLSGAAHLTLRAPRLQRLLDVSYAVQVSPDLISWSSAGLTTITDTATLLEVRDDNAIGVAPGGRRFLRLEIAAP